MTLRENIQADMKAAMKERDQLLVTTLRGILAGFTNELVAKKQKPTDELSEADALAVIKRAVKQRKDSIEQFRNGGRTDLAEKEEKELAILSAYLPEKTSIEAIEEVVKTKMEEMHITEKSDTGRLMGAVMKEFAGNAEGNDVRIVIERLL